MLYQVEEIFREEEIILGISGRLHYREIQHNPRQIGFKSKAKSLFCIRKQGRLFMVIFAYQIVRYD
jgi:hypothetical protein